MILPKNSAALALENFSAKVKLPDFRLPRLAGIVLLLASNTLTLPAAAQTNPRDRLPTFNSSISSPPRVTASMYERIRPGMFLGEVERIIGFPGTPRSTGAAYNLEQAYTWNNQDGSGIVVWAVNRQVSMIGKFGLLESATNPLFSYALFSLIRPGMTASQIETLFGFPGQVRPGLFREDWGQAFQWQNTTRSYITVYFKAGKVTQAFTDLLPPSDLGITETKARARATTLEVGMTQDLVEDLLGTEGVPYPTELESGDLHFLWQYGDGSILLVRFDENRQAIAIESFR